jgi:DNA-binding PadR family transcriptional regulator
MSILHATLGVLLEGEQHGYRLAQLLAERVGSDSYNSGQIHMTLERLERKGWAHSVLHEHDGRRRRTFAITPAGRAEFEDWLREPIPITKPTRDEIVLRLPFLGERDICRLTEILKSRRNEYADRLRSPDGPTVPKDLTRRTRLATMSRKLLRFREEAELRWIEYCLAQLGGIRSVRDDDELTSLHGVPPGIAGAALHSSASSPAA